jgi:D-alanyl-D-alanine carboxypeptidase/D-alanyl-D-alanine-endopeptidase (penicillin-binding protein 4)
MVQSCRYGRFLWLVLVFQLPSLTARADGDPARAWLEARLKRLASDSRIAPARVGVVVQDVRSGRSLVALRHSESFNVASCAKLITAGAALWALGPEYRFKTVVYASRDAYPKRRHGPTVEGDIYLKGFGSPDLGESDLWQIVDQLKDRGIRTVQGKLVIDESFFDRQRLAPLYDSKSTDAWYRPPNGALSLSSNMVRVRVFAGDAPGDPARVVLHPRSSYIRVDSEVKTVARRRRSWVRVNTLDRNGHTVVKVRGRVRVGSRQRPFRRRIEDPGLLVGHALLDLLGRRGIRVGRRRVVRGKTPPKARVLAAHHSVPLAVILRGMNKYSNNFVAEQITKTLGAEVRGEPATWAKGLKVAERFLETLAIQPGSYKLKNGSGLYNATAFSPAQLVRVLRASYRSFRSGPDFVATLPQAGVDGTLEARFIGSGGERYVRAKTGTLARVVALSGYAGSSKRGRGPLAFAILFNDLPEGKVRPARKVADEMATAMVTYLER